MKETIYSFNVLRFVSVPINLFSFVLSKHAIDAIIYFRADMNRCVINGQWKWELRDGIDVEIGNLPVPVSTG